MNSAFFYHPDCINHQTGAGHPESPQRVQAIYDRFETSTLKQKWVRHQANKAPLEWIETNHSLAYVQVIKDACSNGQGVVDEGDTHVGQHSFDVARLTTGAALEAVDAVMGGAYRNAFVACRPPGHHACEAKAMGFCLFNHVAIAARYAKQQYGLKRVLIVDWDVHHGNGTQDSFYNDPSVYFMSLHQHPFYPGSGSFEQQGEGEGKGFNLNAPIMGGATIADYRTLMTDLVLPQAHAFEPELVLISAGFDAHQDDPLAQVNLVEADFAELTGMLMEVADKHCESRIVSLLEGGYHLNALAASVEAHMELLSS